MIVLYEITAIDSYEERLKVRKFCSVNVGARHPIEPPS